MKPDAMSAIWCLEAEVESKCENGRQNFPIGVLMYTFLTSILETHSVTFTFNREMHQQNARLHSKNHEVSGVPALCEKKRKIKKQNWQHSEKFPYRALQLNKVHSSTESERTEIGNYLETLKSLCSQSQYCYRKIWWQSLRKNAFDAFW